MASLIDALATHYRATSVQTASVGGSGTWAMDSDPNRHGFPEEFAGEEIVVEKFQNVETPFGPIPRVKLMDINGIPAIRIPRHGWHVGRSNLKQTLATFWFLHSVGVQQVVVDASVGGVQAKPGDLVVPDDVMIHDPAKLAVADLAHELGIDAHVRMAEPFCPRIRKALLCSAARLKDDPEVRGNVEELIDGGIYYTTPLSIFETAAEVRFLRETIGATVVGQSSGQEAAAARLCGMCLAVVNPVANFAEGGETWTPGGMGRYYDQCALPVGLVTYWALQEVISCERDCNCPKLGRGVPRPAGWLG